MLRQIPLASRIAAAVVLIASVIVVSTTARASTDTAAYRTLAGELMAELDAVPVERMSALSGYGQPSIAIRTVNDTSDIEAAEQRDHSRRMLAALRKETGGRYRFVALDAIDKLIVDIKSQGLPEDEERSRIRALRANANADILVHGTIRNSRGGATLSYDAINPETGELLATTSEVDLAPRVIQVAVVEPKLPQPALPTPSGTYRPTVEEAEQLLFERGYNPGPIDGYMTPETRAALSAYQADSALPVNGRLTRRVMKNLRRDTRVAYF